MINYNENENKIKNRSQGDDINSARLRCGHKCMNIMYRGS